MAQVTTSTPTATPTATRTPTPSATLTPGVRILNYTSSRVGSSYRHVIGEISNETSNYVTLVKLTINFFNGTQLVETQYTYTHLRNIHPHEKTCFGITVQEPTTWTSYAFEPLSYSTYGYSRPNLPITTASGNVFGSNYYRVIGQIRNDDSQPLTSVSALASMYDSEGRLIECDYGYVSNGNLGPGQVSSFDILGMPAVPGDVASYVLQTDGWR